MLDLLKILFLMLVIQGSVIGQEDRDTLSFLHISDVHFCNLNGYHPDFVEKRQHYGGIADSFQTWIREKIGRASCRERVKRKGGGGAGEGKSGGDRA